MRIIGWYPLQVAEGRLILSVERGVDGGLTVGRPLADAEDRNHTHKYSTKATFRQKDIAAIGCCNNQGNTNNSDFPDHGNLTRLVRVHRCMSR